MDWKKTKIPSGSKLFMVHSFTFMYQGKTYILEIDEFSDGTITGHGEQSTDKSHVLESVSAKSVQECLESLIRKIERRP
jgi:hypothetical protein